MGKNLLSQYESKGTINMPKVLIVVEGGVIQGVFSDVEGLECRIRDYDTDGADYTYVDTDGNEFVEGQCIVDDMSGLKTPFVDLDEEEDYEE